MLPLVGPAPWLSTSAHGPAHDRLPSSLLNDATSVASSTNPPDPGDGTVRLADTKSTSLGSTSPMVTLVWAEAPRLVTSMV